MAEWYHGREGQQYGPVDDATLRARIATGEVAANDLVWKEGMPKWLPLAEVAELGGHLQGATSEDASPYATPVSNPVASSSSMMPPQALPTSGLAISSMVCGILAILASCMYMGILFGIPAVICGHMAMKRTADPQNPIGGRGMAIAGLICGYLGSLFSLVIIAFLVFAFSFAENSAEELREEMQREVERAQEDAQLDSY